MNLVFWLAVYGLLIVFGLYATVMARQTKRDSARDNGLAIMVVGRAFPDEAIRSLHVTADGGAIFVRLHDNKAGFMRNLRTHYACLLIEPGSVRVRNLPSGKGFAVDFVNAPAHSGEFVFSSAREAAEVSLWLLGNYVSVADKAPISSTDTANGTTTGA